MTTDNEHFGAGYIRGKATGAQVLMDVADSHQRLLDALMDKNCEVARILTFAINDLRAIAQRLRDS